MSSPIRILFALVALAALTAGAWLAFRPTPPVALSATVLPAPAGLPEFALVDGGGARFDRDALRGRWSLVFFGFTHCPDVCPLTLQVLASARQRLADAGFTPLPDIVFVSVDPERDTVDSVREYASYFGPATVGVTGDLAELRKLTDGLGIYFRKAPPEEDGSYGVDHSAAVLLVDPDANFRALFGAPHDSSIYVHDLPVLMGQQ